MAAKDDYQDFKVPLNDLKLNSKPLINFLTILAEEKMHNAPQIVRAIEERIVEARGDQVLPTLYVLDSIVKNLRSSPYVQLFEARLPVLFANAFQKVDERTRSSMFKLRQTWPPFFTNLSLYNLDTRAHDIDPAWPMTARVPDPPPFSQNTYLSPNLPQRNAATSPDQQPISDETHQQILRLQQDDGDSATFRTRTVNQPPVSMAPPKISELSSRGDTYHMVPLERMEQIRQETAHVLDLGVDGEQQSKIKKLTGKKKKGNKKRRPSARLRRRAAALSQGAVNNDQGTSSEEDADEEGNAHLDHNNDHDDDDDDDEPFIIKQSSAASNGVKSSLPGADGRTATEVEALFGGTDKDYRDSKTGAQSATTKSNSSNLDADSIFEINSKCLLLAEQKYKSKELSSEEYHATLKLLQNILESEVKRLTVQQTANASLLNGLNPPSLAPQSNSLQTATPIPSHPFQQQLLQFAQQHAPQQPTLPTLPTPPFPFPGFGNDAYRHVMQILATVGAPSSYTSNYNFLPYLPPLPPAPPSFTLVQSAFQAQQAANAADQQIFAARQSPPLKRPHDENSNSSNNPYGDDDHKRPRYDPVTGRAMRTRNFDEENVAPVPSLVDANVNMLKKKYVGIVQQLYIGKFQCRACGLRFTARQKSQFAHHLDWHYLENKHEKDLSTTTTAAALLQRSRHWYPSVQEWTMYEENIDEQMRMGKLMSAQFRPIKDNAVLLQGDNTMSGSGVISCPAVGNGNGEDDRCFVCHDPFENFFDDNREEWHLKDAMRVDGKTYHPICYQDVREEVIHEHLTVSALASNDASSLPSKLTTNDLSVDTPTTNSTTIFKTNPDDAVVDDPTPPQESDDPTSQSTLSLVDLVGSIFMKKEDVKPVESVEQIPANESEGTMDTMTIPLLSSKHERESETVTNNNSEDTETTSG